MSTLKTLFVCMFGPRLYSFYKLSGHTLSSSAPEVLSRNHRYEASALESISDYVIRLSHMVSSFGVYFSPVLLSYLLYKRNVPGSYVHTLDHNVLLQLFTATVSILAASYCTRGFSRFSNPEYLAFLRAVEETRNNPTVSNKRVLAHFNSDFSAFPVDFRWMEARDKRPPSPYSQSYPSDRANPIALDNSPLKIPIDLVSTIIMKTIGRRIIYPGSLSFLQSLMQPAISAGRSKLIEEYGGIRHKLESYDGNSIDSMFIDRRGSSPNGDYLVIGCEGNGGFYELGTIFAPLEAGYSVLGWNHPGFGGSTGIPYPDQDVAAVDIVVKFAMDKLSFAPSQIVMYGWSIGGFTATWAGMRYPNIHGLVIDASFDHIIPLAGKIFPEFLHPIIERAIRKNFDLDNSRHLSHFEGPILLIRRSQDEVISLDPFNSPPTNRANNLLIDIFKQRFPLLIDSRADTLINDFLKGNARYQESFLKKYSVGNNNCLRLLLDYFHTHPTSYPVNIGPELDNTTRDQLVLFLASKHIIDFDDVHCAPLPARYFQRPWNLIGLAMNSSSL